jgi:hypothetical protein
MKADWKPDHESATAENIRVVEEMLAKYARVTIT